ncbi:hypothetical protein ZIOFF_025201 [Zingiber officinale]|uniref:Vesicle-fusing ATPase n=1 Tax=Zingiber officinale TaxID=94328 RepID=A0A8J5GXG4_ZINOF|nr:hypothetical protein ZIOFF_025201 [Zingiber officinale]
MNGEKFRLGQRVTATHSDDQRRWRLEEEDKWKKVGADSGVLLRNQRLDLRKLNTGEIGKGRYSSLIFGCIHFQIIWSGAKLEGVVRSAVSYALNRQISFDDLTKPLDEESIKVTMDDFLNALHEVGLAFGASMDDLERRRLNGIIDCGERHKHIHERALLLVEQIKDNQSPLVTYLLEGPTCSGKTSMAATIGIESDFPYVKMISAESMIGLGEATKCAQIVKACSSDEDGLLGFDIHSDGHGQRLLRLKTSSR